MRNNKSFNKNEKKGRQPSYKFFISVLISVFSMAILFYLSNTLVKYGLSHFRYRWTENPYHIFVILIIVVYTLGGVLSTIINSILLFFCAKFDLPILIGYQNNHLKLKNFILKKFIANHKTGEFNEGNSLEEIVKSIITNSVSDIILLLFSSVFLMNLNLLLYFISFLLEILKVYIISTTRYIVKKIRNEIDEEIDIDDELYNLFTQSFNFGIKDEKDIEDEFSTQIKYIYNKEIRSRSSNKTAKIYNFIFSFLLTIVGVYLLFNSRINLSNLLTFLIVVRYFSEPFQNLASLFRYLMRILKKYI